MASNYDIRPSIWSDVPVLAKNMREADKDEVWAAYHQTPRKAVFSSYLVSRDTCFTGTVDGRTMCMFGVHELTTLNPVAVPWMLGTPEVEENPLAFLKHSRKVVDIFRGNYAILENYVDARNTIAVKWLQWLGFSVYYPEPWGAENLPFHRFEMRS